MSEDKKLTAEDLQALFEQGIRELKEEREKSRNRDLNSYPPLYGEEYGKMRRDLQTALSKIEKLEETVEKLNAEIRSQRSSISSVQSRITSSRRHW